MKGRDHKDRKLPPELEWRTRLPLYKLTLTVTDQNQACKVSYRRRDSGFRTKERLGEKLPKGPKVPKSSENKGSASIGKSSH
jgi:hypothetical protein